MIHAVTFNLAPPHWGRNRSSGLPRLGSLATSKQVVTPRGVMASLHSPLPAGQSGLDTMPTSEPCNSLGDKTESLGHLILSKTFRFHLLVKLYSKMLSSFSYQSRLWPKLHVHTPKWKTMFILQWLHLQACGPGWLLRLGPFISNTETAVSSIFG